MAAFKTNAMRILERNKIAYNHYEYDAEVTDGVMVAELVGQERAAAAKMVKNPADEDKIFRAYGILKHARLLTTDEFMELASLVRLGASRGILDVNIEKISQYAACNHQRGK